MYYIIDGNNLAGKMRLIGKEGFDKTVIEAVKNSSIGKKEVIIVFDSLEIMGDKLTDENLTIYYTPRDSFYVSADDKIIELVKILSDNKDRRPITIITEDIEIIEEANEIAKYSKSEINVLKSSSFMKNNLKDDAEPDESLDDAATEKINQELMDEWIKKAPRKP